MMKYVRSTFLLAVMLAAWYSGAVAAADPISIVASNWKFTPATISLKAGVPVTLHFTASEGVHGVQSDQLGIALTTIPPGKGVDVTITPKTPGTYVVPCAIMCGIGHATMKLTVKVVP